MANRQKVRINYNQKQECGVKIRSSEKDQLIAELRQQLYDLRNQNRNYKGINDEIFNMENRYRMTNDDKLRGEHEARNRLDRGTEEVGEAKRSLEELKYLVTEKTKLQCGLMDELARAKRLLEEKSELAGRLKNDSVVKGDLCVDERTKFQHISQEIEQVKAHRADLWKEI